MRTKPPGARTDAELLLSLPAQHPDAKVDATEAGYRAALARLGG